VLLVACSPQTQTPPQWEREGTRLLNGIFLILKYGKICEIDRICDFNKKVEIPIFLYKNTFIKKGRSIHEKNLFISF
jgi:hypothetical protein